MEAITIRAPRHKSSSITTAAVAAILLLEAHNRGYRPLIRLKSRHGSDRLLKISNNNSNNNNTERSYLRSPESDPDPVPASACKDSLVPALARGTPIQCPTDRTFSRKGNSSNKFHNNSSNNNNIC